MNRFKERDKSFASLERKVGIFVLSALAAMAIAVILVGAQQGIFTPKETLSFLDESGKDLNVGMAVKIRGFRIGRLKELTLNEAGRVEARLAINRHYMKWIRTDSVALLEKEMLIGDSAIEITPGSDSAPPIDSGGMIAFERQGELAEAARSAIAEVKPVLLHIRKIIEYINDPEGDFKSSIANINHLTAEFRKTRENVDRLAAALGEGIPRLVADLEGIASSLQSEVIPDFRNLIAQANSTMTATERTVESVESSIAKELEAILSGLRGEVLPALNALLEHSDQTATDSGRTVEMLKDEVPAVLGKVNATLDNIVQITNDLKKATAEVPGLAAEGDALLEESRDVVRSVEKILPFGPPPPEEDTLEADSYEQAE